MAPDWNWGSRADKWEVSAPHRLPLSCGRRTARLLPSSSAPPGQPVDTWGLAALSERFSLLLPSRRILPIFPWYSSLFSIYFLIHWNTKSKLFLSLHSFSDLLDFSLPCRDIWNSLAAAGSSHRQPSPPLHRLYSLFLLPQTVWGNWLSLLTAYLGNAIPLPSLLVVSTQLSLNSLHASSTDTHTWTCNFRCYMVGLSKDHAQ